MLIAVNDEGHYVSADRAAGKGFKCPVCLSPVILKKGRYKIPHFSHQRIQDCFKSTYKQESAAHLAGKHELYRLAQHEHVAMEYYLHDIEQIPDILVNNKMALEIQLSVIPVTTLIERTYGYRRIGMDVIWIAAEESLKKEGQALKLTLFQRSMVNASMRRLITYDAGKNKFYRYQLTGLTESMAVMYKRQQITAVNELMNIHDGPSSSQCLLISESARDSYIRRCQSKKSVLEPTLSALYQLRINWQQLPEELGIIVPSQFYIRTHPIQWQSRLRLLVIRDEFTMQKFKEELDFFVYYASDLDHEQLTKQLLQEYREAVRNLYVQI
ncbi:competence protein CoiA [Macrococcus equipercicus]|uniref:Competence protein CoiA n=1 Tax=Macrococcus equipercicus TaxID=69967 RepID=A0A9Q9BU33_9STAP|nr:competence protein CoiA family protein [Macrococcus equipercicus]UTH14454.1 hypothetical protein KFV11_03590 [Macrococcus equipercicus]